jgi:hypothetical protein
MLRRAQIPFLTKKPAVFFLLTLSLLLIAVTVIRFNITGDCDGIFLLKGEDGSLLEIKDDLFLGEGNRNVIGIDFERGKEVLFRLFRDRTKKEPYLYLEWNEKRGDGFIRNYLPDGKQLLTSFSRFTVENNGEVKGLFVGGGLPADVNGDDMVKENATGMAYYDGAKWIHLWCTVNEALFTSKAEPLYPLGWKYLGSRILRHDEKEVVLESSHEVMVDGVPLHIDRRAYFRAGDTYFTLSVSIRNVGKRPAIYTYLYGDEPWLGNYGTSGGNVGWTADGLHDFAGMLDTSKVNYAGFIDYGNDAIGEGHNFTQIANFVEWFGANKPMVWFSNSPYNVPLSGNIPLNGNERFIGLEWGLRSLQPNQSETYTLALGMTGLRSIGSPLTPAVDLRY